MAPTSNLTRYRTAVFAITGAAAAYGIYVLYTTYSSQPPKSALRRSNAVRPRPRRHGRFSITHTPPDHNAPLGKVVLSKGDRTLEVDVNSVGAPTVQQVRELFPDVPDMLYEQLILNDEAIHSILDACLLARNDEERKARLRECGVVEITEALEADDLTRVLNLSTPLLHQIVDADHEVISAATINFLSFARVTDPNSTQSPRSPRFDGLFVNTGPNTGDDSGNLDIAETEELTELADGAPEPEQGLKGLLYHIAETDAKRKAYEHRGIRCEECGENPIRGHRWHCLNCPDFDLCSTCESNSDHYKTHVFVKIKIPLPVLSQPTQVYPLWYSGAPDKIYKSLLSEERANLRKAYDLDDAHMDALFDQFASFANVSWPKDPLHVHAAIDRNAFNKALTCERWPKRFRPNAMYDRMFAFYDTDGDSLIGFTEFLDGIAYLRGPKRFSSLHRALQGFDIDADGYLDRRDFLRLMQAKFEMHQVLVSDMVAAQEREQTRLSLDILRSSQPISSVFSYEAIPGGQERVPIGKARDVNGDLQPLEGTKTILDDGDRWEGEQTHGQRRLPGESHEQLRHHLSRFEEMLSSSADGADSPDETPAQDASGQNGHIVEDSGVDAPLDQDVIWEITQEGFNEILDRMFKAKEDEDREVVAARPAIERWRKEIEEAVKRREELKEALEEEVRSAEKVDPLLETAMNSLNGSIGVQPKDEVDGKSGPPFNGDIVPTDDESLTKREEEIAQKPLEELLKETGYSTVEDRGGQEDVGRVNGDDAASEDTIEKQAGALDGVLGVDGAAEPSSSSAGPVLDVTMPQNRSNSVPSTGMNGHLNKTDASSPARPDAPSMDDAAQPSPPSVSPALDSTMPQFRPNSVAPTTINGTTKNTAAGRGEDSSSSAEPDAPPSHDRLERLANLAALDRDIVARGGPGRLSYDEIEAMARSDKELKGVVTDWLEWASF